LDGEVIDDEFHLLRALLQHLLEERVEPRTVTVIGNRSRVQWLPELFPGL
jgi:hypothetical protein